MFRRKCDNNKQNRIIFYSFSSMIKIYANFFLFPIELLLLINLSHPLQINFSTSIAIFMYVVMYLRKLFYLLIKAAEQVTFFV